MRKAIHEYNDSEKIMRRIYGPYYQRKETEDQRMERSRKTYRHIHDSWYLESLYWRYQIQDIFEQLAREIRKPTCK